jgi:hypothetical protein
MGDHKSSKFKTSRFVNSEALRSTSGQCLLHVTPLTKDGCVETISDRQKTLTQITILTITTPNQKTSSGRLKISYINVGYLLNKNSLNLGTMNWDLTVTTTFQIYSRL